MGLSLYGPRGALGLRHHVAIEDDDAQLLFVRLPAELGVTAPVCARLWDELYTGPRLDGADVRGLRGELEALATALADGRDALRRRAPDVEVFLVASSVLVRLGQLLALCDDTVALAGGVECVSE
jgi:hypothetical protein